MGRLIDDFYRNKSSNNNNNGNLGSNNYIPNYQSTYNASHNFNYYENNNNRHPAILYTSLNGMVVSYRIDRLDSTFNEQNF